MSHPYQLTLSIKDTEENVTLSGSFDEDEWSLLNEFLQYVDELIETKYVKGCFHLMRQRSFFLGCFPTKYGRPLTLLPSLALLSEDRQVWKDM